MWHIYEEKRQFIFSVLFLVGSHQNARCGIDLISYNVLDVLEKFLEVVEISTWNERFLWCLFCFSSFAFLNNFSP